MRIVVKMLTEFTADVACRYFQEDRINYLYSLLEFNSEFELDKKLVEKVKKGLFPNNIYDVDLNLIDGSIATMYNKYNAIKYTDGIAKVVKCSKCGKSIGIHYSRLIRLRNMASKHENACEITTCSECKKAKKSTVPKKKSKKDTVKVEAKLQNNEKNRNGRIYNATAVLDSNKKPTKVSNGARTKITAPKKIKKLPNLEPISTNDILADALKEIKLTAELSAIHPISSVPLKPSKKVSIHEDITPMRGNSLGNLLNDIKV